ncbi:MAG: hypothetical protein Q7S88_02505 [Candidatus Daviesbacteria bacterium]|nr:hypothetical protein [Candidatus Daviesbacteria bacterium]
MTEIEIRGLLNKKEAKKLKDFLDKKARFEKSFKRLSVEISPGFDPLSRSWSENRLNLRIKKSNQEEKISLKVGEESFSKLEEHEVILSPGQFVPTLQIFSNLGFDQGMIYFWESWVYEYLGVEIKISRYTEEEFMWEIEARGELGGKALEKINNIAQKLKLRPLNFEEFLVEVKRQNLEIFELFSLKRVEELLVQHY